MLKDENPGTLRQPKEKSKGDIYMNDEKAFSKIDKAVAKKKSGPVLDVMKKADKEVLIKALEALGKIGDEDSCNRVTNYLDHEDKDVRLAACKAAVAINTEYMKTRVRYQLSKEADADVKKKMQEIFQKVNG